MNKLTAQSIVHAHIDPGEHEFLCICIENDIHNLVNQEVANEVKTWEEIVEEERVKHEAELALQKKRTRIALMTGPRFLKTR